MGDKHSRRSPRTQEVGELPHETPARGLVERGERFVEKQYLWIEHERPRQAYPLCLSSGQHPDRAIGKIDDFELLQHRSDTCFTFGFTDPAKGETQTHVMKDRTAQEQRLLEDGRDSVTERQR